MRADCDRSAVHTAASVALPTINAATASSGAGAGSSPLRARPRDEASFAQMRLVKAYLQRNSPKQQQQSPPAASASVQPKAATAAHEAGRGKPQDGDSILIDPVAWMQSKLSGVV